MFKLMGKKIFIILRSIYRFVGGELNTCYNAVDRHVVEGNGGQLAIVHDSPVTKTIKKISYRELLHEVKL